jgi:hypothetical protein
MCESSIDGSLRRLVTRTCEVCDWQGEKIEMDDELRAHQCPVCYAPTRVERKELLVPVMAQKNALAAALSRLGASKGGRSRANRLSASRRRAIARSAAAARWRRR